MKKMYSNEFSDKDHELIEFSNELNPRIQIEPKYFNLNFSPNPKLYGRFAVLDRLSKALDLIPTDYGFLIWDAYRPRAVQASLFQWMREEIRQKFPWFSEEENFLETKKYMSVPSVVGEAYCPPHLSGGAIDLTFFELENCQALDLGTPFDDCTERAHSDYFNKKKQLSAEEKIFKDRRGLLQAALIKVGFTSYRYEWWHFDLGDIFWSQFNECPAVFGPLFGDEEWPIHADL
ncbi:MAG: hypothetical protein H0U70_12830 [Tatlockia sp.]|nr:hypothetical protein [Tatlockia sp.]